MNSFKKYAKVVLFAAFGTASLFFLLLAFDHAARSSVEPFLHTEPDKAAPYYLVRIEESWKIATGSASTVVAVIDTGIDAKHSELAPAVMEGFNFVTRKPGSIDEHGHGTHVSGIIHLIAPGAKILPLKFYSDANPGSVNLKNTVAALNYAVDHKVKIINYSGGGPEASEDELLALKRAEAAGILVVVAAGNEHEALKGKYYPAAYRLSNMVVVGALDRQNGMLRSSNFGPEVDLWAPGENIYAPLPGRYGYMSGTSQATAFVTGAAALLMGRFPGITPAQIRARLKATTAPLEKDKRLEAGRLDIYQALVGR